MVVVAASAAVAGVVLIGHALLLTFSVEPTTAAMINAARGERVMFFALPGLAVALLALVLRRRRGGMVLALGAVVLSLTAAGFDVVGG